MFLPAPPLLVVLILLLLQPGLWLPFDSAKMHPFLAGQPLIFKPSLAAPTVKGVRIPRIIHQTHATTVLPFERNHLASWRQRNAAWEIRFYDDAACLHFVRTQFPRYLAAYQALPQSVERADFFRYVFCCGCSLLPALGTTKRGRPTLLIAASFTTLVNIQAKLAKSSAVFFTMRTVGHASCETGCKGGGLLSYTNPDKWHAQRSFG